MDRKLPAAPFENIFPKVANGWIIFFIKFVKNNPNKTLLLNSRITVYKEALKRNYDFEKINKNKAKISSLEQLRDTLLPKLMNGEIDLDKVEI